MSSIIVSPDGVKACRFSVRAVDDLTKRAAALSGRISP
nr:MAG TPA_asm: hypothetical protein [Caudoviricetes sp.]